MLDTVRLAKRGIRAGLICTEPFVNTAAIIAETHGAHGYPFAVLPHPAASLPDGPRRKRARQAAQQLIRILSEDSVQILAEENG